ncbi:GTP-binding protein [Nannocystis punicea]|uniref:GTP-binding protein n=1 Tax=Nannocystis punicea TaxID=2995304 RepID=A0ABY7H7T9_9BACT|nr:GTP-binding protein [Nannocystis poenicansa]WAS95321.1 GTP-binding protein [Nannocystis poenicansa]
MIPSDPTRLPILAVGVIGSVQDGKTTLAAALTRVTAGPPRSREQLLDRCERLRGVTILGKCLEYCTEQRRIFHWDCPGHPDHGKNTIKALSQVDVVILVVSVAEGVREQTREHLQFARALGVAHVIVFLNMCDLLDVPELLDLVELETRELLGACGFDGDAAPVIRGSAELAARDEWREPLYALRDALDAAPLQLRDAAGPLVLPVVRTYSRWYARYQGIAPVPSTVLAGRIERGTLRHGDALELVGHGPVRRGRAVQVRSFERVVTELAAGESAGCQFAEVPPWDIAAGMVLATPGTLATHRRFVARLALTRSDARPRSTWRPPFALASGYRPHLYVRAADITCTVTLTDAPRAEPGERVTALIELDVPTVLAGAAGFILRDAHWTVATGEIAELLD